MYNQDHRIVATLDAGGTNFVFSAIQGNKEIVEPIVYPSNSNDLNKCLQTIVNGFQKVFDKIKERPVAISFAFPGPADYEHGIIGDLPNFPSFRGGVALGPYLEEIFQVPVFINNDGNLYAYGEAIAGILPEINAKLKNSGSTKVFKNLLGITLGTGFGAGVVIDNKLLLGDNGAGGDVWCCRNKKYPAYIIEESVSIRAVKRVYKELSGDDQNLTPKEIFDIAEGIKEGNQSAAIQSFEEMGEMAGDTIANSLNLIDGIVVIGGGLSGANKYIVPALTREMNKLISTFKGEAFPRMQTKAFNLNTDFEQFATDNIKTIKIHGSDKQVQYDVNKRIGVISSQLGASKAISLGAYAFALNSLDK